MCRSSTPPLHSQQRLTPCTNCIVPTPPLQVDSPKEYATKVYTLMKIALGYDVMPEDEQEQQEGSSSSAASKAVPVEAEVETVDENDPWNKKQ